MIRNGWIARRALQFPIRPSVGEGIPRYFVDLHPGSIRTQEPMWNLQTGDVAFKHCSMQNLADHFNFTGTILYNLNLPVVERTGLDGFFDFTLSYPAREFMADKDGVLIFAALRKLGLDGENSCSGPRRGAVGELKASLHRKHWGSR